MTNYSFTIERSSALLEASSTALTAGFRLEAAPGTLVFTYASANVIKQYTLQQAPDNTNNFTLNSVTPTVNLLHGRVLQAINATSPVFALTGRTTDFRIKNARLVASRGFISLTGYQLTAIYLKSTTLPALRPTKREFIPPVYSTNNVRTINGYVSRRIFASVASGAELKLTYENLPESETSSLLELFDTALGTYRSVSLPAATFAGAEPALQAYLNLSGTNQRWAFTGPPTMETAAPGVHTVSISLRSRIVPASPRAPLPNLPACETPIATVCHPNVGTGGTSGVSNSLLQWLNPSSPPAEAP